mmetsp:Transcript_9075/g.18345  ORF Transcript_9075/g.18345 Transcript_9075/m.18345 type:complete len:850 (+) Transcript_9075:214-2763(+)
MSRFNFNLSRLCGTVHTGGNLSFSSNTELNSCVGNRITTIDLVKPSVKTLPMESRTSLKAIAVSPKGPLMITVDQTNHCMLVNTTLNVCLHRMKFKKSVSHITFSPTGTHFSVCTGRHVQVWRTPSLRREFAPFVLHRTYTGHTDDVKRCEWSEDGRFLLTAGEDNTGRVYMVDGRDGYVPKTLAGHREGVIASFWISEESGCYTVSKDGAVFSWIFNPNEDTTADRHMYEDGSWNLSTKHYLRQEGARVTCASASCGGAVLAIGFTTGVFGIYNMPGCENVHSLSVGNRVLTSLQLNGTGEWVAVGVGGTGQLLVWEWQSESYVLKQQAHGYQVNAMAYSPDGSNAATGGEDGKVKLWSGGSGFCFVTFQEHTAPVKDVTWTAKGVVISASLDGTVRCFDTVRYRNFRTLTSPTPTQFLSVSADSEGEIIAAGSVDPFDVYLWSMQTGKLLDVLSGHKGPVCTLKFAPIGGVLSSGAWDGTVKVWDVYKSNNVETLIHQRDVLALDYRGDGKEIVTATSAGTLNFWDLEEGELKNVIEGHRDIMGGRKENDRMTAENNASARHFTSVTYSADGAYVLAGGNSKYICIYNVASGILVKKFVISHNRSLDGTLDKLNSKYDSVGGPISEVPAEEEERAGTGAVTNIPGAKRLDTGERKSKQEVRTIRVAFSPGGEEFCAVTTEGMLIWRLDEDLVFDPIALTEDVTPHAVNLSLQRGQYGQALIMSLLLNETPLIAAVVDGIPTSSIELVTRSITRNHYVRFLQFLAEKIADTPHIEYYNNWLHAFAKTHGKRIEAGGGKYIHALRAVMAAVRTRQEELKHCLSENVYTLQWTQKSLEIALRKIEQAKKV